MTKLYGLPRKYPLASARMGPIYTPRAKAAERLSSVTGRFALYPTLETILNSLGTFQDGFKVVPISVSELPAEQHLMAIPFQLSTGGTTFFSQLLGAAQVKPRAYLLLFQSVPCKAPPRRMKSLPYGILFEFGADNKKTIFFSFEPVLLSAKNDSYLHYMNHSLLLYCAAIKLFGNYNERIESIEIKVAAQKFSDGELDLLALNRANVPSHQDQHSCDFQTVLGKHSVLLRGKKIVEIGAGSGVNVIYALKFGAASVWASEKLFLFYLLSRWNLQYAQDSGQISPAVAGRANIVYENGFDHAPEADFYLFNTPSIRSPEQLGTLQADVNVAIRAFYYIEEDDFAQLFGKLRERLSNQAAQALWRILPVFPQGFNSRFFQATEDGLGERAISEAFLRQQGLNATPNPQYPDIFLIAGR